MRERIVPNIQPRPAPGPRTVAGPLEESVLFAFSASDKQTQFIDGDIPFDRRETLLAYAMEQRRHLQAVARHYDETVKDFQILSGGRYVLDENSRNILQESRHLMGEEYCRDFTVYLRGLEALIQDVMEGIGRLGLGYFMEEGKYSERAAQALENVFKKMEEAKKYEYPAYQNATPEQSDTSASRSTAIIDEFAEKHPEILKNDHVGETAYYAMETQNLNFAFDTLEAGYPANALKDIMAELARDTVVHLYDQLGRHGLQVLIKTGDPKAPRNLDHVGESPLGHVGFLIEAARRTVRELGNLKAQRELLLDEENAAETGEKESVSA